MPLPILKSPVTAGNADLVRFFYQVELEWARHLGHETQLDCATAIVNPQLKTVYDANRVFDAAVSPGIDLAAAFNEIEDHFAAAGAACHRWLLNPSLPPDRIQPLADYLINRGYVKTSSDVLHLPHLPKTPVTMTEGLKIIPGRASLRHFRSLAQEPADHWNTPEMVEATMLHLDDPRYDVLLALKDGQAVGVAGVQSMGEVGGIQDVFVSRNFRNQGIGRTLLARVLEICIRSLHRHIILSVDPANTPAIKLYHSLGFEKVGEYIAYAAPGTVCSPL